MFVAVRPGSHRFWFEHGAGGRVTVTADAPNGLISVWRAAPTYRLASAVPYVPRWFWSGSPLVSRSATLASSVAIMRSPAFEVSTGSLEPFEAPEDRQHRQLTADLLIVHIRVALDRLALTIHRGRLIGRAREPDPAGYPCHVPAFRSCCSLPGERNGEPAESYVDDRSTGGVTGVREAIRRGAAAPRRCPR